ncbi:MAG: hypothetical protein A3B89_01935 [Candidatus Buchananbacteria bacterium RIFCSPHIGHO2_02_FULL_40_13]|uniref:Uncharacterized protein n=1 Tax=Candidatus Buchananbacteria bacterium RIFCSPLOWO2_01_FULL_39_33 TaxID=1797543 RepID=A0A1G1YJS3_9BACT|nr:MAG: hypothetical protein A2820_03730 [Candidatus Buchananbacteria bacterium RIFCSPHIGHO2_01_FULL_40_35]OGY50537.1 MAG: hypothetical protein A3B89_01935 [Candidatus Buchananbacteria bacterium RIFCSPHIGHO2_02_FULL_40_13]OGY52583.1 MAG: hypothetical protein A3A02_00970 [Candidatus Buchananbacteria bacterium RIFCSPLOWO2_01_FULL_39_33]
MAMFFLGLFGLVVGFLMVWKPTKFLEMIGEPGWSEKIFGSGRGQTAYQAIGIIVIIVSIIAMTGLIQGIILSILGPLFSGLK